MDPHLPLIARDGEKKKKEKKRKKGEGMSKSEQSLRMVREGKLNVNGGIRVCEKRSLFCLASNQRRKMEKVAPLSFFCSVDEAETLGDKSDGENIGR